MNIKNIKINHLNLILSFCFSLLLGFVFILLARNENSILLTIVSFLEIFASLFVLLCIKTDEDEQKSAMNTVSVFFLILFLIVALVFLFAKKVDLKWYFTVQGFLILIFIFAFFTSLKAVKENVKKEIIK